MKKIFYLKTCDTCRRIMSDLNLEGVVLREIKSSPVTEEELQAMYEKTTSYEALFNKRARKYKELGLKDKSLSESDFKTYLLQDYTFLKRPVALVGEEIFVGNAKKNIETLKQALS